MERLHRTQILLEPRQYQHLQRRAEREHRSLSDVVRTLVQSDLALDERAAQDDPLWDLVGLAAAGPPFDTSEHVDEVVYGEVDAAADHSP